MPPTPALARQLRVTPVPPPAVVAVDVLVGALLVLPSLRRPQIAGAG